MIFLQLMSTLILWGISRTHLAFRQASHQFVWCKCRSHPHCVVQRWWGHRRLWGRQLLWGYRRLWGHWRLSPIAQFFYCNGHSTHPVCCLWIKLFIPHLHNHRRPWRDRTLHIKYSSSRRWVRRHQALPLRIQQLCNRRWLQYHQALRLHIQPLFSRRLVIHHQTRPERRRKWQEDGEGEQNGRRKKMEIWVFRKDPTNL